MTITATVVDDTIIATIVGDINIDVDDLALAGVGGAALIGTANGDTVQEFINSQVDTVALAHIADDLRAGTAVTIGYYGDSTARGVVGQLDGDTDIVATIPAPEALEDIINEYFGNTALTVTNHGVDGGTATWCLNGTDVFEADGPFEEVLTATSERAAFIGFGINDATDGGVLITSTTAEVYMASLASMIQICRSNDVVPVLVTPYACLAYGFRGTGLRAERTKYFADAMRLVAKQYGVALVDINELTQQMIQTGKHEPIDLIPDGVHPAESLYLRAGYTASRVLISQMTPLTGPEQYQPPGNGTFQGTAITFTASAVARFGHIAGTTGAASGKTLRIIFDVRQTGLDLYLARSKVSSGTEDTAVVIDGTTTCTINMNSVGFTGTSFIQDFEDLVAENLDPGVHLLSMTSSGSSLNVAVSYLRTRRSGIPSERAYLVNGTYSRRVMLSPKVELVGTSADAYRFFDSMPSTRTLRTLEVEFDAQLPTNTTGGFVIHGFVYGPTGGSASLRYGVVVYLNASGFLTVREATAAATQTTTVVGGADLSGGSHTYRISISTAGLLTAYVDGSSIGTVSLAEKYTGGLFGLWRATTGTITVNNLYQIYR